MSFLDFISLVIIVSRISLIFSISFVVQPQRSKEKMNRRRHLRIEVPDLVADVSDGVASFSGNVSDVSRYGMLLDDIPGKFNEKTERLSIVFSVNGIYFKKMKGIPRWTGRNNLRKRMGIHIPKASPSWTVFVKNLEPREPDLPPVDSQ